jgi:hypothetical protein
MYLLAYLSDLRYEAPSPNQLLHCDAPQCYGSRDILTTARATAHTGHAALRLALICATVISHFSWGIEQTYLPFFEIQGVQVGDAISILGHQSSLWPQQPPLIRKD